MMDRKHRDTFSEPRQAPDLGLLAKAGRVVVMASVLAVTPMITGFPQVFAQASPHPVASHVRRVGFVTSSMVAMRADKNASRSAVNPDTPGAPDPITTARAAAVTPVQDVAGAVTVVGVTWPKGAVTAGGQFQIRTLSGATWSKWASLGVIDGGPDRATATTGTDPYVVTGASKYQVRSLSTQAKVPAAATVQAVDPGASSADNVQAAPGGASAATTKPTIYTRAQWGADESKMTWSPSYGKITVGFVHHTVSANNYAASDVPAMIRGIYAYHAQTLGWGDIGYNFLVDRFGRIWEGRYGGMDKPVIGGHTLGYNSLGMGVSAIGNFDVAAAPQAMVDAYKRIFAWKFALSGIPATGTVVANGNTIQRITGHQDVYQTACPGQYLYARIPEIRSGTAAIMAAANIDPTRDPFGQLDSTSTKAGAVTANGWAIDPDSTSPIMVQMYIDGIANALTWANVARPDVGAAYPADGPNHGYTLTMQTTPGPHTACLYAINTGPGTSRGLGCQTVTTVNGDPSGQVDAVTTSAGKVTARGWAIDPDTRSPIMVQMYVDGVANALAWANVARPDVGVAYPADGPNHGYTVTMQTTAGPHTVCLYAINTGPGTSRGIGCRATNVP